MIRIDDQGVAHGLRQHSIGSTYPVVIVGKPLPRGGNVYYLKLGNLESVDMPNELAQRAAERLASICRERGIEIAKQSFEKSLYYKEQQ